MFDRRKKHNKSITPVINTAVAFPFLGSQALLTYMIYDWFTQKEKSSQRDISAFRKKQAYISKPVRKLKED